MYVCTKKNICVYELYVSFESWGWKRRKSSSPYCVPFIEINFSSRFSSAHQILVAEPFLLLSIQFNCVLSVKLVEPTLPLVPVSIRNSYPSDRSPSFPFSHSIELEIVKDTIPVLAVFFSSFKFRFPIFELTAILFSFCQSTNNSLLPSVDASNLLEKWMSINAAQFISRINNFR